ncbi:MAG: inositol monophosphatase family protein [Nitrospirota bacterium]
MTKMVDLDKALNTALVATSRSGEILRDLFKRQRTLSRKTDSSIVTEADIESENAIKEIISNSFAEHSILSEEAGFKDKGSNYIWCIDPLDGTTNFLKGFPVYAVSIALLKDGYPVLGVVHEPESKNTFYAIKGNGASLNGERLSPGGQGSKTGDLQVDILIAIGSIYRKGIPEYLIRILRKAKNRNIGSAALHLCYVAMGWFDAYIGDGGYIWDIAGGTVVLEEAGGTILTHGGSPLFPMKEIYKGKIEKLSFIATGKGLYDKIAKDYLKD